MSQQLIHKLLKAEEEAEALIAKARENRVRKLREAKQAADDELAVFKKKEDEKFNVELSKSQGSASGDNSALEQHTVKQLETVNADFVANKDKLVEYLAKKVMTVQPELSQIQVALLDAM